jgi:hypothetical protein
MKWYMHSQFLTCWYIMTWLECIVVGTYEECPMNYYKSALVFSLEDDNYYSALGVCPSIHLLKKL